jgi:hypothetical protein
MQRSTTHPGADTVEAVAQVDVTYQAYQILHWGFAALPILAGLDKFFGLLANWDMYLAPSIANLVGQIGLSAHTFMHLVGAIEIIAGALVAFKPRFGAYLVAVWLAGIIVNLLLAQGSYDIALRDFGLLLGAIALGRLGQKFD